MRKAQKAQAEEFIKLLAEAHEEIKLDIEKNATVEALDLLGQCQQGAIELGTLIENIEGEGFVTVGMLEKYCEVVFEIYQALEQEMAGEVDVSIAVTKQAADDTDCARIDAGAAYQLLTDQLALVEESIEKDIKVRKEVVFLPYKASMWDSLESVWKAADADPDCDAYVIPIPYYDKNPDGSFREYHYEGTQYPSYVPVTWYENYDFAERQPDKIFIHNPYDHCNIVTSVHPFFYSKNLKQFTEELVYIPYFILEEVDPENDRAVEAIEHYIAVPGVQNADKVIVQSEAMRQAYVRVMVKYTGEAKRAYWEEKILGLGSPKVDKVLNTRKEDLEIPEEWLKIIQKPDGSWKKIIFYNTTVTALLNHNEQMLIKIRDVLRVFKENKDDVALLWRPHPLMKATIESMRPHLWEEYSIIVEQYKAEGWGIYDDSADLDRAVAICNGYYGDQSSVVGLVKAAGKPVMIQAVEVLGQLENESVKDVPIWPSDFCIDGDDIWFVHGKINVLMRYCMSTKAIELIGSVPKERILQESIYIYICKYIDKLYLIPRWGREIAVYHIKEQCFQKIPVEQIECDENSQLFYKVYAYGKYLYCFSDYNVIVKIDMEKNSIQYMVSSITNDVKDVTILDGDDKICFLTENNTIVLFDMQLEKICTRRIECNDVNFTQIVGVGSILALYDCVGKRIYKYELDSSYLEVIGDYERAKIEQFNNKLLLVDVIDCSKFILVDVKENKGYVIEEQMKKKSFFDNSYWRTLVKQAEDKRIFVFSTAECVLYQFENECVKDRYEFRIENKKQLDFLKGLNAIEDTIIFENVVYDIQYLWKRLPAKAICNISHYEKCGEQIYILKSAQEGQ